MLGTILKELRKNAHKTQQDLADYLEIARGTYAHYEINRREPDITTIKKLADYYKVTTDYLLGMTNDPTPTVTDFSKEQSELIRELNTVDSQTITELRQYMNFLQQKNNPQTNVREKKS
jgi:transcriptional regulator with XRE-family HTH domain